MADPIEDLYKHMLMRIVTARDERAIVDEMVPDHATAIAILNLYLRETGEIVLTGISDQVALTATSPLGVLQALIANVAFQDAQDLALTPDEWMEMLHPDKVIVDPGGWRQTDTPLDRIINRHRFERLLHESIVQEREE